MFINENFSDAEAKIFLKKVSSEENLPFCVTDNTKVQRFCDGGQSLPLNIGDEIVVKMPKSEETFADMKFEGIATEICSRYVHGTNISTVMVYERDDYSFVTDKLIKGKTMDMGERGNNVHYSQLSEKQKDLLAADLASFLYEMHRIPIDEKGIIPDRYNNPDKHKNIRYFDEAQVNENKLTLLGYGINLDRYPQQEEDLVCSHMDLHGRNIAIDETKDHVLQGVFDFGLCGFNKRSADFVKLYTIDRELGRKTIDAYNKISPQKVDVRNVEGQFLAWCAGNIRKAKELLKNEKYAEDGKKIMNVAGMYLANFKSFENKQKQAEKTSDSDKLLALSGRGRFASSLEGGDKSKISTRGMGNFFRDGR